MLSTALERWLPYSAEQLFDLAADIERYPQFLRWWKRASVRECNGERCRVDNAVALGPISMQFRTQASLLRPRRIEVTSDDAPFRRFRLSWEFQPQVEGGCRVILDVELELRSLLLQGLVERVLRSVMAEILAAFEVRARELYGALVLGSHS